MVEVSPPGITELSTIDWPGKLATLVFFQGCNFRCPWCQNVDGVDPAAGKEADTRDVIERLKANAPVIDSFILTGGEPLLQADACLELLRGAKELELKCAIETNGSNPDVLRGILPYLDFVAIDIKAPLDDPQLYSRVIGLFQEEAFVKKIRESMMLAIDSKVEVEARTTVIPTLNDDEATIARVADGIRGVDCLRLQQFRNQRTFDQSFQKLPMPSRERLLRLACVAKQRRIKVKIFTVEGGLEVV